MKKVIPATLGVSLPPLKREDVICPICFQILLEPVSFPCKHRLCLHCFKKFLAETAITCPICRKRLSVWSRKATKENNLVDQALWERIKKEFPRLVQAREDDEDSQTLEPKHLLSNESSQYDRLVEEELRLQETPPPKRDADIVQSGAIRAEYEKLYQRHQEDVENRKLKEEEESISFIRQLQDEEGSFIQFPNSSTINSDYEFAKTLQSEERLSTRAEALKTPPRREKRSGKVVPRPSSSSRQISDWCVSTSTLSTPPIQSQSQSTGIRTQPVKFLSQPGPSTYKFFKRQSSPWMSTLSTSKKKTSSSPALPYASACATKKVSPSITKVKSETGTILSFFARQSPQSQSPISRIQSQTLEESVSSSSKWPSSSDNASQSLQNPLQKTFSSVNLDTSQSSMLIIPEQTDSIGIISEEKHKPSSFVSVPVGFTAHCDSGNDNISTPALTKAAMVIETEITESKSNSGTPDSISMEVNSHFRPIRTAPKTPPKRSLDGSFMPEPSVVISKPLRLFSSDYDDIQYSQVFPDEEESTEDEDLEMRCKNRTFLFAKTKEKARSFYSIPSSIFDSSSDSDSEDVPKLIACNYIQNEKVSELTQNSSAVTGTVGFSNVRTDGDSQDCIIIKYIPPRSPVKIKKEKLSDDDLDFDSSVTNTNSVFSDALTMQKSPWESTASTSSSVTATAGASRNCVTMSEVPTTLLKKIKQEKLLDPRPGCSSKSAESSVHSSSSILHAKIKKERRSPIMFGNGADKVSTNNAGLRVETPFELPSTRENKDSQSLFDWAEWDFNNELSPATLGEQEKEYERLQARLIQEQSDMEYARNLQSMLKSGLDVEPRSRRSKNRYEIRNWFKQEPTTSRNAIKTEPGAKPATVKEREMPSAQFRRVKIEPPETIVKKELIKDEDDENDDAASTVSVTPTTSTASNWSDEVTLSSSNSKRPSKRVVYNSKPKNAPATKRRRKK